MGRTLSATRRRTSRSGAHGKVRHLSIQCRLLCLAAAAALTAPASAEDAPTTRPEPRKLAAFAFVTVRSTKLASKAVHQAVAAACRKAVPAERFESLTVPADGSLKDVQRQAGAEGAKLFLHITVGAPKRMTYTRRVPVRAGRWRGKVEVDQPYYTLRCPVMVEMSIPGGPAWRAVKTLKMTSAQAAGAEEELPNDRKDLSKAWPDTASRTVRAAVERTLVEYFFRHVKLRAIECEPVPRADEPPGADEPGPQTLVKIELTNRSHCRVLDATVTVESYDRRHKRWEPVGAPRGLARWIQRRFGRRRSGGEGRPGDLHWPVPAIVDSGQKAFSEERPVSEALFHAMNTEKCRIVLHATPATVSLRPPAQPAPLKPTVKATP